MATDPGTSKSSGMCCSCFSTNQVLPFEPLDQSKRLLEIRENRLLCVHHINPRPRSKEFEEEMQAFIRQNYNGVKYRPSSIPAYRHHKGVPASRKQQASHDQQLYAKDTNPHRPNSPQHSIISPSHLTTRLDAQSRESTNLAVENVVCTNDNNLSAKNHMDKGRTRNSVVQNGAANSKTQHQTAAKDLSRALDGLRDADNKSKSGAKKERSADNDNKPVLFLLHGVAGSAGVWKAQIEHFSSLGYEVVAPDLVGHGQSPAPRHKEAYSFSEILIDVFLVFDLHCKTENIIIGHSYGACFGAVLARRRRSFVQKLILISGGAPTPLAPQPGLFSLPVCTLSCLKPVLRRGFNKTGFHQHKHVSHKETAFSAPTHVIKYTMNGQDWLEGNAEYHSNIDCPTLLIHGSGDRFISVDDEVEMTNAIYGSILHVLDDASHMVMMDQPTQVNAIIKAFITGASTSDDVETQVDDVMNKLKSGEFTPRKRVAEKNKANVADVESVQSGELETYRLGDECSHTHQRRSSLSSSAHGPPGSREHTVYMSPKHAPGVEAEQIQADSRRKRAKSSGPRRLVASNFD